MENQFESVRVSQGRFSTRVDHCTGSWPITAQRREGKDNRLYPMRILGAGVQAASHLCAKLNVSKAPEISLPNRDQQSGVSSNFLKTIMENFMFL